MRKYSECDVIAVILSKGLLFSMLALGVLGFVQDFIL